MRRFFLVLFFVLLCGVGTNCVIFDDIPCETNQDCLEGYECFRKAQCLPIWWVNRTKEMGGQAAQEPIEESKTSEEHPSERMDSVSEFELNPEDAKSEKSPEPDLSHCQVCQVGQGQRPCYPPNQTGCDSSGGNCLGLCRPGTQRCVSLQPDQCPSWGQCTGATLSSEEMCDGLDNDCDGSVDETFPQKGVACQSQKKGICAPGVWTCKGQRKVCESSKQAGQEICGNGQDDDCDGSVDDGCVSTIAGDGQADFRDGQGTIARFNTPTGLAFGPSGHLFVSDTVNHRIRKVDRSGNVSTIAGDGNPGTKDSQGVSAQFNGPNGITFDSKGNIYIADFLNHKIRWIDTTGKVSSFAGSGTAGGAEGSAQKAQFRTPSGVAWGMGVLFVADSGNGSVRAIKANQVSTWSQGGQLFFVRRLVSDGKGNLFVSANNQIVKIDSNGVASTFVGSTIEGYTDDIGIKARFSNPAGLTFDSKGNLYVADVKNNCIRRVDKQGNVTTVAGAKSSGSFQDGHARLSARFNAPFDVAYDGKGALFIADSSNHRIRKLVLEP